MNKEQKELESDDFQNAVIPVSTIETEPIVVEVDGIDTACYGKLLNKPFDIIFSSAMELCMQKICEQTALSDGCIYGYTYSDKIIFLLRPNYSMVGSQELVSKFASLVGGYFNSFIYSMTAEYKEQYSNFKKDENFKSLSEEDQKRITNRVQNLETLVTTNILGFTVKAYSTAGNILASYVLDIAKNECFSSCQDLGIDLHNKEGEDKLPSEVEKEVTAIFKNENYTKRFLYGLQYSKKNGDWISIDLKPKEN